MEIKAVATRSSAAEELRGALERGMVQGTVLAWCEKVETENRQLQEALAKAERQNEHLGWYVREQRKELKRLKDEIANDHREVLERQADYRKHRDWRVSSYMGAFALGALAVALATVIALI